MKVDLPPALTGRSISSVVTDPAGRLWVLSSGGLATLDKGKWQVSAGIRQFEPMHASRSDGIFSHPSGMLAVMASGHAFRILGDGRQQAIALPGDDTAGEASLAWMGNRLVINRGGRFWREEGNTWVSLPTLIFSPAEQQRGPLRVDGAGHLYLLTDRLLYHLSPGAGTWRALPDIRPYNNDSMNLMRDGRIWILQNGQILRGFRGTFTSQPIPRDITQSAAKALCLDREWNIWISNGSLVRLPARGMVRVHAGPGYPPRDPVWRIFRDRAGRLWVTSSTGLFRQDEAGWQAVPGVPRARDMETGPDDRLYVCDRRDLIRVEMRTLKAETVKIPLLAAGIAVERGPVIQGEKLWVSDALGRLITGDWGKNGWTWSWDPLPEMAEGPIKDIMKDDMGRPWAIFADQAYCRVEGKWEKLPTLTGSRGGGPMDISFPSRDEGLVAQYDPPTVLAVRRSAAGWAAAPLIGPDQLRNIGVLYSIGQDPQGSIWIGSDRGVMRIEPGEPPRFQQFGSDQGLPSEDTDQRALLVEGSDRVWVGTTLGLVEIRTGEIGTIPPPAAPSFLEVHRGPWIAQGPDAVLDIQYGRGPISWELGFSGPAAGHDGRFEFREAERPWTALSGRALQFPTIPSGHHVYEIRILPANGPPGPSRRLDIYVHPPWYQHPLAYLLWGLLAAGLVTLGSRWRFVVLRRRNRELNRAIGQATEELRQHRENLEKLVAERTVRLKQTSRELMLSEARYRHLFDASPDGIVLIGLDGRIIQANDSQSQMFAYGSSANLIGVHATLLVAPSSRDLSAHIMRRRLNGEDVPPIEYELVRKDGTPFYGEISASILRNPDGTVSGYICITRDTTGRKLAEDKIRASLKEKEVLLQEIHHRVKNNLQIISGLLTMQSDHATGRSASDILRESQGRIRSMALLHEKMYSSHNLAEIALDDYLIALTKELFTSHGADPGRITAEFQMDPLLFTIEKSIPLGLIVNELVSNALKHAFPAGRRGKIRIGLLKSKQAGSAAPQPDNGLPRSAPTWELIVADDGIGLPAGFSLEWQKTLGMHLVSMLAKQLQAELKVKAGPGAEFRLIFTGLPAGSKSQDERQTGGV